MSNLENYRSSLAEARKRLVALVAGAVAVGIIGLYGLAGVTTVELGETGIKTTMIGENKGTTEPIYTGFRWVEPFTYDVDVYYTKFQQYDLAGEDAVESQTNDGQPVKVRTSFQIGLLPDQVPWLHENVGKDWYQQVFYPAAIKAIKDSSAMVSSDEIYTGAGRVEIAENIQNTLQKAFAGYGIRFETNLRDVTFENAEFVATLEEKARAAQQEEIQRRNALAAKQQAIAVQNKAEGEKFKIEQMAEAERTRLRLEGEGERLKQEEIAKGILAIGQAEADVIQFKNAALEGPGGELYRDIEVLGGLGTAIEFYGVPTGAPGTNTYIIDEALRGKIAIGGGDGE